MSKFTTSHLNSLKAEYSILQTMDPNGAHYGNLCQLLDRLDDEALEQLSNARVKFVSLLAMNRCIRRGLVALEPMEA